MTKLELDPSSRFDTTPACDGKKQTQLVGLTRDKNRLMFVGVIMQQAKCGT